MLKVLSGNKAAVYGAKLARVEVAAVYPITPQSQISEDITKVVAAGELDCDIIEVEGEHSAMSAIIGASTVGARVFTATSSWGLAAKPSLVQLEEAAGQCSRKTMVFLFPLALHIA